MNPAVPVSNDLPTPLPPREGRRPLRAGRRRQERRAERVAEIADRGGFQLLQDEQQRRREKAERAAVRDLHRMVRPP